MDEQKRRLAGILAADIVGYSAMVAADEPATLARVRALRSDIVEPLAATHDGRLFKTMGDGFLLEFASAVQALRCAIAIQETLRDQPHGFRLRIGVHQGEVVPEGDDLVGDGIIIAARLEPLAEPGGICISGRVREDAAGKLSLELEDLGEPELKNIAQRHRVFRVRLDQAERPAHALPDKPSIAVLPFQNMSGDPEQEYFADGIVEEIITVLSRIRWLFVIARNSTFTYRGKAVDVKRVGRELGVRYVLEGSVRKAGGRVRITAQLVEAETGAHLWADRFDGSLEDVFTLQDKVATDVAGVIEPALQASEIQRAVRRPTTDLTAYDLWLRAQPLFWSLNKEGILQALALLEEAIGRDPQYGPALAWAGICRMHVAMNGWDENADSSRRIAVDYARRALVAGEDDPAALANAAYVLAWHGEDIDTALGIVDRALALNPSFARGWYISGNIKLWAGDPDTAIERLEISLRLSPRARVGSQNFLLGLAYLFKEQFDRAAQYLQTASNEQPGSPLVARNLAVCYAYMGRLSEAREIVERVRATGSLIFHTKTAYRKPEYQKFIETGLQLAMGQGA